MKSLLVAFALLSVGSRGAVGQTCEAPDVAYIHGHILTGRGLTTTSPEWVEAVSVLKNKIVYAGQSSAIAACPAKETIDLHGAFAMPGFNDAHTHIASAGQQRLSVDLDGMASLKEMQQRIRDYTAKSAPGQWILGGGWDHTRWTPAALPTRQDLDAVTAGHPAFLYRTDGHIAVANTAALAAANITQATSVPSGGQIDKNSEGRLTGIIREAPAIALLEMAIPKPTADVRRQALKLALQDASAHGVTSVQDFSDWDDFLVLESLEKQGDLHVRVSEWLTFNDPVIVLKQHQAAHPVADPLLHTGMLKGFMDGSLGSRTAALAEPYADDPGNYGIPRYSQQKLNQMTAERAQAGFQIGFHAIGDRANSMALNAFDFARAERMKQIEKLLPQLEANSHASITLKDRSRYRIEHAQVLSKADFLRFERLQIIASMQPSHLLTDMAWAQARLGPERAKYSYAWKSFLDHKVVLAFGTDYPVESISPFRGLYAAVTRQNEAGTAAYQPQEKLTIGEAIFAYTQGSAFAENAEKEKGLLQPGFLADLVVLDRDITTATPLDVLHTRVLRTVLGGSTVYVAPPNRGSSQEPAHWRAPDTD